MDEVELAVMLVDVSGSTALYERVGNVGALRLVSECLDRMRLVIDRHGGEFVSSKGDDVLSTFTDPHAALDAGMTMFEITADSGLTFHAGLDFGPVIRARDDVFGDPVNVAARLSGLATAGELLCTEDVHSALDSTRRSMLRFFGPRHFKGKAAPSNIYLFSDAVPGQATEISISSAPVPRAPRGPRRQGAVAALRYCKETFVCKAGNPVVMGRAADCDLVMPLPWVSRKHATMEVRDGKVYLRDRSSAGTYVRFSTGTAVYVSRETILLPQSCTVTLGRNVGGSAVGEIACEILGDDD